MYNHNLELIGFFIAIAINIIANLFLFIDIISSPRSGDPVVFVFFIGMVGMFIANVILLIILANLHSVYSGKGVPIHFTKDARNKIGTYKKLFIVNVLTIFSLAFLYFTAYKIDLSKPEESVYYLIKNNFDKTGDYYVPFFNFTFDPKGTMFEKMIEIFMLLFKIVLSGGVLGVTGLMVYYSYELSKLRTSRDQLYIPDERDETVPKTIPHKGNYSSFSLSNMFQNLNINYLLHSTTIL
jgi:hypothetical protein